MKHRSSTTHAAALAVLLLGLVTPVFAVEYPIPDTGQDLCYDWERILCDEWHMDGPNQVCDSDPYCPAVGEDFYGQDAQYNSNPPDMTDNGDGTVTDNLTGLIWEQKNEANDPLTYTYNDAAAYCDNLSLGGFDDWRMPSRKEYSTILNLGRLSPSLDTTYFPFFIRTNPTDIYYWTSSDYHDDPSQSWIMQLSFGIIDKGAKVSLYKVRCVRGTPDPAASYTANGNGTVTDNVTGLMWEQKTDDGGNRDKDTTYTWKDALAYCENLVLGSFSDWRLPNPKELERLVDLSTSSPAIDTAQFPHTSNGYYWTSSTCVGCHKFKAFAYNFSDGALYFGVKYRDGNYPENYARCVRTAGDTPTTTTAISTTTSSQPNNPCAVEEIYGESSAQAALLRQFRDGVLVKSPEGRAIIELYYRWSPLIAQTVREDDQLREESKVLVGDMIDLITAR
jgi:hypothetical protein